jgi:hypothetical protein
LAEQLQVLAGSFPFAASFRCIAPRKRGTT